jgi:hypothetical protein
MIQSVVLAALLLWCGLSAAVATPSRIIILRHGEKEDAWKLCGVGQERLQQIISTVTPQSRCSPMARDLPLSSPSPCMRSSLRRPLPEPSLCG